MNMIGKSMLDLMSSALKVEAAQSWEPHVEHEAARGVWALGLQEIPRGGKGVNIEPYSAKEAPRRLANELASVDDEDVAESGPIGLFGSAVPDIPIAVIERFGPVPGLR
jgi:hypothetical protein